MAHAGSSIVAEKTTLQAEYDRASASTSSRGGGGGGGGEGGVAQAISADLDDLEEPSATPPPYSGPTTEIALPPNQRRNRNGPQFYPGLPRIDYQLYSPPLFELSSDCTTLSSKAPYLSSAANALVELIRSQASVPPKPQIHIVGTRNRKVDFDIKFNLMSTIIPDDPKQRMDYVRCVSNGEVAYRGGAKPDVLPEVGGDGGLEEWCRRFVEDPAQVKSFTLNRVVANLDTPWIEGQLRSMIASTGYKGVVTITFPVTHARVVVQTPDKLNRFFTSVTTLFAGKNKYEVVQAVWPFATSRNGTDGRRCIVQSEAVWWKEWRDSLKYAVATKRRGWVTNEDKLEALMEGKGKGVDVVDWGPDVEY
ncbi:hypothetical protein jhhlp_003354 [Lomentospora prolificans]|uniref:Uncharacterized protein n=1 Tax=Lomentospora prolificans TaxID=41688 RepID=A0A2N3NGK3_9PEZI|nr:hypothetical protein jhhlp_003354 [Lomentospora prolificans]